MAENGLYVLLCSGEHEKLQMAAMAASVAAVCERPVSVFVSMNAIYAFEAGVEPAERYRGGRMSEVLKERQAPDAVELLRQGKQLGELQVWACSMALDVLDWDTDKLVEDLFDGARGLTGFLSDAEAGQLVTF